MAGGCAALAALRQVPRVDREARPTQGSTVYVCFDSPERGGSIQVFGVFLLQR